MPSPQDLKKIANQLRIHSIVATAAAASGHPTTCLSCADIMAVLFFSEMKYFPRDPKYPNNDRFVLSKGHAAPILYAAWAEAGLFSLEDLKNLRKLDSDLEGHPTPRQPFTDVATGSLGQGLSAGVGSALAARFDGLSYRTFVLMGDGEVAEGAVYEACNMAAFYKLDNLVGIIDVNRLGQSRETMFAHDISAYRKRFEGFGWEVISLDGHDIGQILKAFERAREVKGRPVMLVAQTFKGGGVSFLADQHGKHGKALDASEVEKALAELEPQALSAKGVKIQSPEKEMPAKFDRKVEFPPFFYKKGEKVATRRAYGNALARIGAAAGDLIVLDGDMSNSTYSEKFRDKFPERYLECFIAEQNMAGVATGLARRGKVPFASTFAAFWTRAYDQLRMAAVSQANVKFFGSHVGVSIGQDGTSQMGLEDIAMMRAVFGCAVLYPCDAVSTEKLVEAAYRHEGLVYIRGTRPDAEVIYDNDEEFRIGGLKVVRESDGDVLTVAAAGVTLHEALKAYEILRAEGIEICVVDLYSVKPLDREKLLAIARKTNQRIVTVEDHYAEGGLGDAVAGELSVEGVQVYKMAVRELPHSGKPEELLAKYRIDAEAIVEKVQEIVAG